MFGVMGCSSPAGNELFAKNGISTGASANAAGTASAAAGTDSTTGAQTGNGGSEAVGGSATGGGGTSASGAGGSEQLQGGGVGGSGGQSQSAPPVIESCDMLDGAVTNAENGHCYRVNDEELNFAAARDACQAQGGHLLTVTSAEENDFARNLHDGEHWLGASDGRLDNEKGVGEYAWVDDEEWTYSDWRGGQPNAVETDCPGHSGGGGCYEHCAYQAEEGDWVDRSCGHTIVSICEWEPKLP
jgi:hypothetical protein